jgi:DNA-binding response OmpR family regulator
MSCRCPVCGSTIHPGFEVDLNANGFWHERKFWPMTPKQSEVLYFLAKHQDEFCTVSTILERVWGVYGGDLPGGNIVNVTLTRIRHVLTDADAPLRIECRDGRGGRGGYKLAGGKVFTRD